LSVFILILPLVSFITVMCLYFT